ncbi:MAG TPA: glycosyltransferase, partial [Bacteroidia bacterium]
MRYSLIAPTFSRPDEVYEFLESLTHQQYSDFEVIIADGSPHDDVKPVVNPFVGKLNLIYIYEKYLPVSDARNRAAEVANGDWLIFLDSDCIIPEYYLQRVDKFIELNKVELFGGPDKAHESFTPTQKAISYAMTSILTTGGIRGKEKHVGVFHPRGFNMGIKKQAFLEVNGYATDFRCGEDIELSMRLLEKGKKSALIPEAFVYHKRRTDFLKFFKQVFRFGAARINIWQRHPKELKITHLFPTVFMLFVLSVPFQFFISENLFYFSSLILFLYSIANFVLATKETGSIKTGFLSLIAAYVMLFGYGWGFLK